MLRINIFLINYQINLFGYSDIYLIKLSYLVISTLSDKLVINDFIKNLQY
jgi:hypothetical protein